MTLHCNIMPQPYPKPKKSDNPRLKRKRRIKSLDRKLQIETETHVCARCGRYCEQTAGHHKIPRRFMATRHDPTNVERLCFDCHVVEHSSPPTP